MSKHINLEALQRWSQRDEWRPVLEDTLDDHLGPACEAWEIDGIEGLSETIGEAFVNVSMSVFEDFLTRAREDDHLTVIEDYLKRRGWKETPTRRRYLEALAGEAMSLYEVSAIVPGQSFLARDLIRGGEPIRVEETTATRTMKPWDRIAARIVQVSGRNLMTGGVLPFSHAAAEDALDEMFDTIDEAREKAGELEEKMRAESELAGAADEIDTPALLAELALFTSASIFTRVWLDDALGRLLGPPPNVVNSDGDMVVLHELSFAFRDGTTAEAVRDRLAAVPELEPGESGAWSWMPDDVAAADPGSDGTDSDDGSVVSGHVFLRDGFLKLNANSESRAARGRAMIFDAAGDLLEKPETKVITMDEIMEKARAAIAAGETDDDVDGDIPELPGQLTGELLTGFLDDHYRKTLDEPVPMLGNRSPRDLAATADGREDVADWLKLLENQTAHSRSNASSYDFGWMWTELDLLDLRR